ncbi:MAG: FG-GAP-like repeat-containing protein [Nitrospira sp.]|nr:FG-GAP-like repeat-containing protein [Nitrospira sp.]
MADTKEKGPSTKEASDRPFQVIPPAISLPKGGGAIRGMGEKFGANPVTGTGSMTVPIATSSGRSGFGPQLSLSYDSGAGNGPFGFGWHLSLPSITRKTEKGLPQYDDCKESDIFILSGAEDLAPVLEESCGDWHRQRFERAIDGRRYRIDRYRPRIEGLFARIERWTNLDDPTDVCWRSISKDNITTWYGKTSESRIADPVDPTRVFSWLICESYDDKGNAIRYQYQPEDSEGLDQCFTHEKNRTAMGRSAKRYLKRIQYGNSPSRLVEPDLNKLTWLFEAVFDYDEGHWQALPTQPGEHEYVQATLNRTHPWSFRQDPFSSYRAGFEVRTYRLCHRVLMFHHFPEELGVQDYLVRSTEFTYRQSPIVSFITAVTQSGYTRQPDGRYLRKSLPPLEFEYSQAVVHDVIKEIPTESLENLPYGLDGSRYQWVDLDGEGASGILTEQGNAWFYKPNWGDGKFGPVETVLLKPSLAALGSGRQQLLDLAGDGQLDVVQFGDAAPGFFERTPDQKWESFRTFAYLPELDWNQPNLRFVDLNGDGLADILVTEDEVVTWYPSLAEEGFGPAERVFKTHDEETGPRLVLADGTQSIYLADMSGDGLTDLVRIRNGEVCYWPNLGYGKFGSKVTMDDSPWFDLPDLFDQRRIRVADIDGSGNTDIIYLHGEGVRLYFNRSGNGWSEPRTLTHFPQIDNLADVTTADLLGNGTACLVWSSALPGNASRPMRFIDLMGGQKPHLLVRTVNNLGAETQVQYAPSTKFYFADKQYGKPWITKLPFPVHVVERVTTYDHISRNRFVTRYTYHHGYFDGVEREFRGFGRVDQLDTEEFAALTQTGAFPTGENIDAASHVPPVLTKTWFHTGIYLGRDRVSNFFAGLLDHDDIGEYYREPGLDDTQTRALLLPDTVLPPGLTPEEEREACRALKGAMLRQEVYALDGREKAGHPYTVTEQNFTIRCLQPEAENRYAVFFTHPREALSYHYERNPMDPRISHAMTLEVDRFGNVLKSAAIGYGRRQPDPTLAVEDQERQGQLLITYTENRVTNAIDDSAHLDDYREPSPCESRTYELTGLALRSGQLRFGLDGMLTAAIGATAILYEQHPTSGLLQKRLIEQTRTLYRRNDFSGPLAVSQLESLALPFESYTLAFTPSLPSELYGSRMDEAMLLEGGYVRDGMGWWVPSGRVYFSSSQTDGPDVERTYASQHFFLPLRFHNPFEAVTTIAYDPHDLLTEQMRDAVGNLITAGERDENDRLTTSGNDYRMLQPRLIMDANRNRAAVAFDALGMVVGTAVMGKPEESVGDSLDGFEADLTDKAEIDHLANPFNAPHALLQHATTRLIYDLFAYQRTQAGPSPEPSVVCSLARETHSAELSAGQRARIQQSFSYSDGFGREIQKKTQAEPGPVPSRNANDKIVIGSNRQPEMTVSAVTPRWVSSGWTVFNNKGKPVRQYEAFFSDRHRFEFDVRMGVSPVVFYDPVERTIATLHPNDTWEKIVLNPWSQASWDVNDTVLRDPRTDEDVGGYVRPYLDREHSQKGGWKSWYAQRVEGTLGTLEQKAAQKSVAHADTPARVWFDSLGRSVRTVAHNRMPRGNEVVDEHYAVRTTLDIEGNQREVVDALGRTVMRYAYDMQGNALYQASMDSAIRWTLNDVGNSSIYIWNSRSYRIHMEYDRLRRPLRQWVRGIDSQDLLAERTVYGETHPDAAKLNIRGKSYYQFDGAGAVRHDRYDFKGNLLRSTRRISREYRSQPTWATVESHLNAGQLDVPALETVLGTLLQTEAWSGETVYDANNRPSAVTSPDGSTAFLRYNEANLLEQLDVRFSTSDRQTPIIKSVNYDARGQRREIEFGNGTKTLHAYDPLTFRLSRLQTFRGNEVLQDLRYVYDPAANITSIEDGVHPHVYFKNAVVTASTDYEYDAVYQLIEAAGREHIGQAPAQSGTLDDWHRTRQPLPNDGQALRRYRERYRYDQSGNLLEMVHTALDGNWRRTYDYAEQSLLESSLVNNRLSHTKSGTITETYRYDEQGNTVAMPHLKALRWDHEDQLQTIDLNGGGRAYYLYDTAGRRVRKIVERQDGTLQKERVYIGGYEVYREYVNGGQVVANERRTLHVVDDKKRVALAETATVKDSGQIEKQTPILRYQFHNHLESTALELDEVGAVISYEDYYPFGGTSYLAGRGDIEVSLKRYRFADKERDEESGLYYFGARYYAPWLGRWTSCDPAALVDGTNVYRYVKNNPINATDPTGMWEMPSWRTIAVVAAVVVVGTVVTVATAGAAGPLVVGAVASVGLTGTAATVATGVAVGAIAGAVGGAAAGAAGEATRQTVSSRALGLGTEEFSGGRILSAAGEGAVTGAAIGGAVGGAAAFATTAAGTAAIGAVGRVAQRVAPTLSRGAVSAARGVGNVASTVARAPGVRQALSATSRGLQAIEGASARLGTRAALSIFDEGSRGAQAVARLAQTGNVADTFGASSRSRTVSAGSPGEVYYGGELNARQTRLLDQLPAEGAVAIVPKNAASLRDVAALTASTGDEFAVLTTGGRRMIIRGNPGSVPLDVDRARELAAQGWRFSAHTHPGPTSAQLTSSIGDRNVLAAFGGARSAIYNSVGNRGLYTPVGDDLSGWLP